MDAILQNNQGKKVATGYRLIFGYLGIFLMVIGLITLIPLLLLIVYPSEWRCYAAFLISGLGTAFIGAILYFTLLFGYEQGRLGKHQDSILLVLVWLLALLLGGFPYFLNQFFVHDVSGMQYVFSATAYSYSEGVFENTSGYTTVGLTIYRDLLDTVYTKAYQAGFTGQAALDYASEYMAINSSHIFIFYRAVTHLVGGVGLMLIVASALSDAAGLKLFSVEGHNDKLLPNLAKSARLILLIYLGYVIFGTLLLWFFGMDWFEALCQSIAALATGGLSSRASSIYFFLDESVTLVNFGTGFEASVTSEGVTYVATGLVHGLSGFANRTGIEVTMCILMVLGCTGFFLHMKLLTGKWKQFFKDCEVRFLIGFFIIFVPLMMLSSAFNNPYNELLVNSSGGFFWDYFRYAAFQFISCVTTSGFSNVANIVWLGQAAMLLSLIAMTIGGGTGSTAGGIKQYRFVIVLKQIYWDLKYRLSPKNLHTPRTVYRYGQYKQVTSADYGEASFYTILYIIVLFIGALLLSFLPDSGGVSINFEVGLYEFGSALSSAGNSIIDIVAYGNSSTSISWAYNLMLWILILGMYLGRLEIIPVYFSFYRISSDVRRREMF